MTDQEMSKLLQEIRKVNEERLAPYIRGMLTLSQRVTILEDRIRELEGRPPRAIRRDDVSLVPLWD